MKRRGFLTMLAGAMTAPLVPFGRLPTAAAPAATAGAAATMGAGYSRLLYGLAVFHAQTRATISATDLIPRLGISPDKAQAIVREMTERGIVEPATGAAQGVFRAKSRIPAPGTVTPTQEQPAQTSQTTGGPNEPQPRLDTAQEAPMEKFTKVTGIAAPMPLVNIDTDMIIPKVFLKTIKRSGLGVNLFDEMRYDRQGNEIPDFVLNKPQYRQAEILIAGDNFGCGSSREHAPWALADFGIKVIVSTSFADIFYNNCFKNGMLPIVLPQDQVDVLMKDAEKGANARVTVDLEAQTITTSDGETFAFEVDAFKKHCLLNGLDDIGLTMEKASAIDAFEAQASQARPWV